MKKTILALGLISICGAACAENPGASQNAESVFSIPGAFWIILIIIALIAALIVVGRLKAQLKTASKRHGAADYIRSGSLHLDVQRDMFLYDTVERRKIQTNNGK